MRSDARATKLGNQLGNQARRAEKLPDVIHRTGTWLSSAPVRRDDDVVLCAQCRLIRALLCAMRSVPPAPRSLSTAHAARIRSRPPGGLVCYANSSQFEAS
jgi:hypothetical protein